jgi:uncharacterized delta-60 repeat protein
MNRSRLLLGFVITGLCLVSDLSVPAAQRVTIQTDGKVVVVGGGPDFAIDRYNSDLSPDFTFGNGSGHVAIDLGSFERAMGVAIQTDGKIMVAGLLGQNNIGFGLVRLLPDGSLDPTFGNSGKLLEQSTGCDGRGFADVETQQNGSIVGFVGRNEGYCPTAGIVTRYLSDGTLDPSFGSGGKFTTDHRLTSFALQPLDGKIVAVGDTGILRLNSNGSLDINFGSGGLVTDEGWSDVALQPDGKIVTAGRGGLTRYSTEGLLDTSFDRDRVIAFTGLPFNYTYYLAIETDGKVLLSGTVSYGPLDDFSGIGTEALEMGRFKPDGSPAGWLNIVSGDFGYIPEVPYAFAVHNSGWGVVVSSSNGNWKIARFAPDVSISGRVLLPNGQGLRNAAVTLTDSAGNRRTVLTSSLGFYSFADIPVGDTVTIAAVSKRYRFQPLDRTVNESLAEVNLVGIE